MLHYGRGRAVRSADRGPLHASWTWTCRWPTTRRCWARRSPFRSTCSATAVRPGVSGARTARPRSARWSIRRPRVRSDLGRPGHIFPLRARNRGVLRRPGHTEAVVDLTRMAGLQYRRRTDRDYERGRHDGPHAAIARNRREIRPENHIHRRHHRLPAAQRVHRRKRRDRRTCPREWGDFKLTPFRQKSNGLEHIALVKGTNGRKTNRCWCASTRPVRRATFSVRAAATAAAQLHEAMSTHRERRQRGQSSTSIQEGRGIGLLQQDQSLQTAGRGLRHGRSQPQTGLQGR